MPDEVFLAATAAVAISVSLRPSLSFSLGRAIKHCAVSVADVPISIRRPLFRI
jgi:hypothetical protein